MFSRLDSGDITSTIFNGVNLIITMVSVTVAVIAITVQQYYQKKQLQTEGLVKAFEILGNDAHREARDKVLKKYEEFKNEGKEESFEGQGVEEEAAKVRRDFDQAGALIINGLAAEKPFMQVYADTVIRTWDALENNIKKMRRKRTEAYVKPFEKLYNLAKEHWGKYNESV